MTTTRSFATQGADKPLGPFSFERRHPGPTDVAIEILYCGVCHSDIHQARNEWGGSQYPMVPGHEIVGRITAVGKEVKDFQVGQVAGVGCMVDSCQHCSSCKEGLEQYCENGFTGTYNGADKRHGGGITKGGYSENIVVEQKFVLRVSEKLKLEAVAPLLCAGITTYSPLRQWKVGPGQKVGIVGLGGLGHMGVKLASAMGAHTVMLTTSPGKAEDAHRLGAKEVIITKDPAQLKKHVNSFDFLLNTVSAPYNIDPYLHLLKRDGTMVVVGLPDKPPALPYGSLIFKRRRLAGSLIGGIAETQEMLDFCTQHAITSDVEVIPIQKINEAYERTLRGDVKYRFVIDMKSLKN